MATLKQRLHRKNSAGGYDTVHLETEWSMITGKPSTYPPDSHTHTGYAASTHNHSATQITSGTLPVARGGTGVTTIDALKSALGLGGGTSYAGMSFNFTDIAVGQCVLFNYEQWLCVHNSGSLWYLVSTGLMGMTPFGGNNVYAGSTLANVALRFQNRIAADSLAKCTNWSVNGVTQKVNIPSYEQYNGGFSWFSDNNRRVCDAYYYWTSSPHSGSSVYYVNTDGNLYGDYSPGNTYGFRPCVAVQL